MVISMVPIITPSHQLLQSILLILGLKKTGNNAKHAIGTHIGFMIKLYNYVNIATTNVVVENQLPDGYLFVSVFSNYGRWTAPCWNIPNLLSGFMVAMTITAKVRSTSHYNNMAIASANQTDPFLLNNSATVEKHVVLLNEPTVNHDVTTGVKNPPIDINVLPEDIAGDAPINSSKVQIVAGTARNASRQGSIFIDPITGLMRFIRVTGSTGTVITFYSVSDMNKLSVQAKLNIHIIEPLINLYPATDPGTLAFEDFWPGKGDYDFNDMVIDYQFEIVVNTFNKVEQLVGTFTLKAFGASFENGFGFQLRGNVSPTYILSVSGYELTDGFINLNSNGVEAGQSKPTFILFDNAFTQMPHPGMGIGVNTTPEAPYVAPKTFVLTINFKPNEISINDLNIGNFNPFIIVNKVRAHEVHLPYYPPTDLVDMSLFGQWEDNSNPSTGRWYVNVKNHPWAINIYEKFDYPIEKQDVLEVHLKFADWAMSGGIQFPDWYRNLPGYRNNSLIYQIPK
jgi:LruC domain-containing protein/uncharacterized repeat protein (TIGR01451 family)